MDIATTSTLKFAAFDPSGNVSTTVETLFTVTNDPVPSAPAFASAPVVGQGTATLSWTAPNPGAAGLTITGYTVQAYSGGTAFGAPKTVAGDVTTLVYDGLSGDTAYTFTVQGYKRQRHRPGVAEDRRRHRPGRGRCHCRTRPERCPPHHRHPGDPGRHRLHHCRRHLQVGTGPERRNRSEQDLDADRGHHAQADVQPSGLPVPDDQRRRSPSA